MKALRIAALAAAMAGAGFALAAPASAELTDGSYTAQITQPDGATKTETWVVTSCGDGCKTVNGWQFEQRETFWGSHAGPGGCPTFIPIAGTSGTAACDQAATKLYKFTLTKN